MIRIRIGGHEYRSWKEVPDELKAQLVAAGVDPGPDGEIDTADLWRAGGPVIQHTEVTGPGGRPLPPVIGDALTALADAMDPPPPLQPVPLTQGPVPPDAAAHETSAVQPARSGRLPLLVWGVVATAAVVFVATVVAIVGH